MRRHPGRNTFAIQILHLRDGIGIDLNLAGRSPQRIKQRVFTVIGETYPLFVFLRDRETNVVVRLPEHVKRRQGNAGGAGLQLHVVVHAFQPLGFVFAFGKGIQHAKLGGQSGEDIEVVA
ncbi:hypothetical protein D3C81_1780970 [compost metagenome]